MEKIFCRLCGSWLVYKAPQTGDNAITEHRRVNHPIIGHAKTVIERDEDIDVCARIERTAQGEQHVITGRRAQPAAGRRVSRGTNRQAAGCSHHMTPTDFRSWRNRLALSQRAAAEALGISPSTIERYELGHDWRGNPAPIPKLVALACRALELGE